MSVIASSLTSAEMYPSHSEDIRKKFDQSHDGLAAIRERSDLVDRLVAELWNSVNRNLPDAERLCLAAMGGYGRQALFPHSDIDIVFLSEGSLSEAAEKQVIPKFCQALWDLHLRVSPTCRTLADCGKL